jgi:hypothetical protein
MRRRRLLLAVDLERLLDHLLDDRIVRGLLGLVELVRNPPGS